MIVQNKCPHCGGDIEPDEDTEVFYVVCIRCGWRKDIKPRFSYLDKANANGESRAKAKEAIKNFWRQRKVVDK